MIADFTGLNIITSDTVQGSLTLRLKDIPWDQALDIILQTKGLDMRKNGNVVLDRAARGAGAQGEAAARGRRSQIGELEPLQSPSRSSSTTSRRRTSSTSSRSNRQQQFGAGAGADGDHGGQGSIISRRGVAIVDPRSNILFVQDTPSQARGSPQDHPADRHADPAGADRGAHRRSPSDTFSQQLGVRFGAQTAFTFNNDVRGRAGRQLSTRSRSSTSEATADPRDAHADAVRARVGHRVRRLFGFAAAQRQPAGARTPPGSSR